MYNSVTLSIVVKVAMALFENVRRRADSWQSKEHGETDEKDTDHADRPIHSNHWKNGIHLSVVACGDRGDETIVLLKSAVLFTSEPLVFHIYAEHELQPMFRQKLDYWPGEYKQKFLYYLYNITFPTENTQDWKKLFKPCASQRLFIPSLLTDVDIQNALAPEHEDKAAGWYNRFARHPYYGELGVNSGVMLMNLTRIRKSTWLDSMMKYYKEYKLKITWGDQDLINIYFHFNPDKLYVYPCEWNYRPDHCMYMSVCKDIDINGVSVLHGCRRVMHNEKQPAFKAVYTAFKEIEGKWVTKSGEFSFFHSKCLCSNFTLEVSNGTTVKIQCVAFLNMLFILYARTPFWMNIVAGPTIAYLSIVMNIIIFVALFHKNIRTPTTVLMQGLALADGLTALCTYGFEPIFNLHYEEIGNSSSRFVKPSHHDFFTSNIEEMKRLVALNFPYCVMHYCLSNLVDIFHLVSILLTTCLGLQKFLAVACPIWSKTRITVKRSAIVCVEERLNAVENRSVEKSNLTSDLTELSQVVSDLANSLAHLKQVQQQHVKDITLLKASSIKDLRQDVRNDSLSINTITDQRLTSVCALKAKVELINEKLKDNDPAYEHLETLVSSCSKSVSDLRKKVVNVEKNRNLVTRKLFQMQ
ncbi:GXYLT [Mytilus coruscus]|uniref:GXYLT n=1 Tax=Mytilus coruscus TaxID=42192 RepID=A0A6J8D2F3_MYTCO|nr:GXYLT [Mytilus coruscus]